LGEPQNQDIKDEVVDQVFNKVKFVDELVFGGGESSLAVDKLKYILKSIKENNVFIGGLQVTTNAVSNTKEFIEVIKDYEDYIVTLMDLKREDYVGSGNIINVNNNRVYNLEQKMWIDKDKKFPPIALAISEDKYHNESVDRMYGMENDKREENFRLLLEDFAVLDVSNYAKYEENVQVLINSGRAKDLTNVYKIEPVKEGLVLALEERDGFDVYKVAPLLTITCDGLVTNVGCNSYEAGDKMASGNILEEDFLNLLFKLNPALIIRKEEFNGKSDEISEKIMSIDGREMIRAARFNYSINPTNSIEVESEKIHRSF
jgi:predicted transcriptional regulator